MILETAAGKFVVHIQYAPAARRCMVGIHVDNGHKCETACALITHAGTATRYFRDVPCRVIARKYAFKAAVAAYDKATRKLLWDAFRAKARYMRPR